MRRIPGRLKAPADRPFARSCLVVAGRAQVAACTAAPMGAIASLALLDTRSSFGSDRFAPDGPTPRHPPPPRNTTLGV